MNDNALFEAIETVLTSHIKSVTDRDGSWDAIPQAAIDLLRSAYKECTRSETASKSEWIACADRLPGSYETVLVTDVDGIRSTGYWTGKDWSVDLNHESDPPLTPMHWIPLPAAPSLDLMATLKDEMKKREDVEANRHRGEL